MNVLFVCNSYNMILSALQIKRYDLRGDDVDIILTDYSSGMRQIAQNLQSLKLFRKVIYLEIRKIYQGGNIFHKIYKTLLLFQNETDVKRTFSLENLNYDTFFFCNFDIVSNQLFYQIKKNCPNAEFHRFEEGYSTYTTKNDYKLLELLTKGIYRVTKKMTLMDSVEKIHLFNPELLSYECNWKVTRIQKFDVNNYDDTNLINTVFGYNDEAREYEKYKCIIFEESFSVDKKEEINDYDLFVKIINALGKENVLIKLHPRNMNCRFANVKTEKSRLPWEVIQINGDFKNTFFVTISSGAIIGTKVFMNNSKDINRVFLFKCTKNKPRFCTNAYCLFLNKVTSTTKKEIFIPSTIEEAINILTKEPSN